MPNIEIHGLEPQEAENMKLTIFNFFKGQPYVWDMVITIYPTKVEDRKGDPQPFFRLVNSHEEISEEIIELLQHLGEGVMDVEYIKMEAFFPKKPPT